LKTSIRKNRSLSSDFFSDAQEFQQNRKIIVYRGIAVNVVDSV